MQQSKASAHNNKDHRNTVNLYLIISSSKFSNLLDNRDVHNQLTSRLDNLVVGRSNIWAAYYQALTWTINSTRHTLVETRMVGLEIQQRRSNSLYHKILEHRKCRHAATSLSSSPNVADDLTKCHTVSVTAHNSRLSLIQLPPQLHLSDTYSVLCFYFLVLYFHFPNLLRL